MPEDKTSIEIAAVQLEQSFEEFTKGFGYSLETHAAHDTILVVLEPVNDIVPPVDHHLQKELEIRLNHTFNGFPLHVSFKNAIDIPIQ